MSMSAYMCSKSVNILKGIIISGFLVCTLALASGGGGGSGGSGSDGGSDGGGGDGGGGDGSTANNSTSMYATGKKLFLGSVVCDSCPYAGLELNSGKVGAVWPGLQRDLKQAGVIGQELSWWQRISVKHYIKKRFSL